MGQLSLIDEAFCEEHLSEAQFGSSRSVARDISVHRHASDLARCRPAEEWDFLHRIGRLSQPRRGEILHCKVAPVDVVAALQSTWISGCCRRHSHSCGPEHGLCSTVQVQLAIDLCEVVAHSLAADAATGGD